MSRRVATLCVAAAALTALVGSVPITGSAAPVSDVRDQVERILAQRARAVHTADADSWRATIDEPEDADVAQFESLQRLSLDTWSEQLVTLEPASDRSWRAAVQVRYRLPGERTDAVVEAVLDLTANLLVAGSTTTPMPPWEIAGVRAAAGSNSLVVGAGSADQLRTYVEEVDRAAASVGMLLGQPPPRVVVVVPEFWHQAGHMDPAGAKAGLAAVTTAADQPGPAAGPVRVLANTAVLARLPASTRTALFGHEAFHVATWGRAAVPRWLSEGLADYAGYHESGADLGSAVAGALRQVRADGAPAALPEAAAFDDPSRATMAYEGAHLAVRMLVAEYGAAGVVAVYRAVSADGSAGIDAALGEILGTDLASVTQAWRAELTSRAAR
jgi:hypothetical protein